jgi:quinoprotein dehydrogenase-associated probable ABC transporter substrate-binding protein
LAAAFALPQAARAEAAPASAKPRPMLAVCADPANLPYSNDRREGFENKIAALLAADLKADLDYTWLPQSSFFLRRTLLAGACDLVISVPASLPAVAVTRPYFTSSYVAVTRAGATHQFTSFDDAWLANARIGLQQVGSENGATPPAMALAYRGFDNHLTFFPMWDHESGNDPQGRIIAAVADGKIDVAFVWGPFAGWFARRYGATLHLAPILADPKQPDMAFAFPMAVGVRKADTAFRDRLQAALDRHPAEIAAILSDYDIPTTPTDKHVADAARPAPPTH